MNSTQLSQSQTPPKGIRSPGAVIKSPTYRGDYVQTRNLPSTNPVRGSSPDTMPRSERISQTQIPTGIKYMNNKRLTSSSPQKNIVLDSQNLNEYNRIIKQKDEQISLLRSQLDLQDSIKRTPAVSQNLQSDFDVSKVVGELDRLNNELQRSRQNEIRLTSIIQNYENQIRDLTDQNIQLSNQLRQVGEQNLLLSSQIQGSNTEQKLREVQQQSNQEIMRLQNQIRELQVNANKNQNSQIESLQKQNRELVEQCENLNSLIRGLKQENQAKGNENQFALIVQQRNQELDQLNNRFNLLQEDKSKLEQRLIADQREISRLENEVNIQKEYSNQIKYLQPIPDSRVNDLQYKVTELQGKVNSLLQEKEQTNQLLILKDQEIENTKKSSRASNVFNRTNNALENDIYVLKQQNEEKNNQINLLSARLLGYEISGQSQEELKNKIILVTNELEKVSTHLNLKSQEYDDLHRRYNQLLEQPQRQVVDSRSSQQFGQQVQLGQEVEKLAIQNRNLADEIKNWKDKYNYLESQNNNQLLIIQSQTNSSEYQDKIRDLEEQLRRKNAEAVEWNQSFINLQANKEREINNLMETLRKEIRNSSSSLQLQNDYNKLKENACKINTNQDNKNIIQFLKEQLANQIQGLNNLVIEKDNEIQTLRYKQSGEQQQLEKVRTLENQLTILQTQIFNQNHQVEQRDSEIQILKKQNEQANNYFKPNPETEYQISQLHSSIVNLQQSVQQKDQTIQDLRQQIFQIQNEDAAKILASQNATFNIQKTVDQLKYQNSNLLQQTNEQAQVVDTLRRQSIEYQQTSNNALLNTQQLETLKKQVQQQEQIIRNIGDERDGLKRQLYEIEGLRQKIRDYESREAYFNQQILQLKGDIEEQKINVLHSSTVMNETSNYQIRIKELESQGEHLKAEVKRLQGVLIIKDHDLDLLRRESERMFNVDSEKSKLEIKVQLLLKEQDRLSRTIQDKQEEVKTLNIALLDKDRNLGRIPALEERISALTSENTSLNQQNRSLDDATRRLQEENYKLQSQVALSSNLEYAQNELKIKITNFQQENERLNLIIQSLTQEKQKWQVQLNEFSSIERIRQELQSRLDQVIREKQSLEGTVSQLTNENNSLKAQLRSVDVDKIKSEYESNIFILNNQINNLNGALASKNEELNQLSIRFTDLSHQSNSVQDLQSKLALITSERDRLNEQLAQVSQENYSLQTRFQSENANIKGKLLQLENESAQWNNQKLQYEQNINYLQSEISKLNILAQDTEHLKRASRDSQYKVNDLETELKYFKGENEKLKGLNADLSSQISSLQVTINQQTLKLNDSNLEYQVQSLTSQLDQARQENAQLIQQIQSLTININQLTLQVNDKSSANRISELEAQTLVLLAAIQQIKGEAQGYQQQIQELNLQINEYRTKLNDHTLEYQVNSLNQQLSQKQFELENNGKEVLRLNGIIQNLTQEINTLRSDSAYISVSVKNQEQQIGDLNRQLQYLQQENTQLNSIIQDLQVKLRDFDETRNKSIRISQEQERLQERVRQLEVQLQELYSTLAKKDQDISNLQSVNNQISTLNQRIEQYELIISNLKTQHEKDIENQKNYSEYIRKTQITQETTEITNKFNQQILVLESQLNQHLQVKGQLENEIRSIHQHNQDLLTRLAQSEERARLAEERSRQSQFENEDTVKKTKIQQQQLSELSLTQQQAQQELERQRSLATEVNNKVYQLDNQRNQLNVEVERQRSQLEENKKIIEQLTLQIRDRDSRLIQFAESQSQNQNLVSQVQNLQYNIEQREKEKQSIIQKYESDINALNGRLSELNSILIQLKKDSESVQSLKYAVEQLQRDNQNLVDKSNQLVLEIQGREKRITELSFALQQLQSELVFQKSQYDQEREDIKVKKNKKEKENEDLSKIVQQQNADILRLQAEINARDLKIRELSSTEQSLLILRQEKDQLLRERESLNQQFLLVKGERDNALQKLSVFSVQLQGAEQSINQLSSQNQYNSAALQAKDKQYNELIVVHRESEYKHNQEAENSRRDSQWASQKWVQEKAALQQEINRLKSEIQIIEHRYQVKIEDNRRQSEIQVSEELRRQLTQAKVEYEKRLQDALNTQRVSYEDDLIKRQKAHQGEIQNIKTQIESNLRIQLEQQLRDSLSKADKQRQVLEEQNYLLNARSKQLEEQLRNLDIQLREALNQQQDTLKWKEVVEKLEAQRQKEIAEFRVILEESKNLHVDSAGSLQEAERVAYNTQIKQLALRVSELVENLKLKDQENSELRGGNANLLREKSELKMQLSVSNANSQLSQEIEGLKRQLIQVNDNKVELATQLKRLQAQISQYEIQIQSISQELNRANEQLNLRKAERDQAFQLVDQLKSQTLSISQAYNSAGGDAEVQRSKYEVLKKEIEELTSQRNMYKQQSERKSDELNRKNLELVEKIGQLDQLKLQYQEKNNKIYILETKLLDKLQTEEVHIM